MVTRGEPKASPGRGVMTALKLSVVVADPSALGIWEPPGVCAPYQKRLKSNLF